MNREKYTGDSEDKWILQMLYIWITISIYFLLFKIVVHSSYFVL